MTLPPGPCFRILACLCKPRLARNMKFDYFYSLKMSLAEITTVTNNILPPWMGMGHPSVALLFCMDCFLDNGKGALIIQRRRLNELKIDDGDKFKK